MRHYIEGFITQNIPKGKLRLEAKRNGYRFIEISFALDPDSNLSWECPFFVEGMEFLRTSFEYFFALYEEHYSLEYPLICIYKDKIELKISMVSTRKEDEREENG